MKGRISVLSVLGAILLAVAVGCVAVRIVKSLGDGPLINTLGQPGQTKPK
jgi:hypothetical protein